MSEPDAGMNEPDAAIVVPKHDEAPGAPEPGVAASTTMEYDDELFGGELSDVEGDEPPSSGGRKQKIVETGLGRLFWALQAGPVQVISVFLQPPFADWRADSRSQHLPPSSLSGGGLDRQSRSP